MSQRAIENPFVLHVDAVREKNVYFRTFSKWNQTGKHGRDIRQADTVNRHTFLRAMSLLGHEPVNVAGDSISTGQWKFIEPEVASQEFGELLRPRECVVSAFGLYWDIELPRGRALSRRTSRFRNEILARDRFRCVQCRRGESEGMRLTLDHVIPYSRGGETTSGNLVTLCEECNQGHANNHHTQLFGLAGLHHGWDPDLATPLATKHPDTLAYAVNFSTNIMVSRCFVPEVPFRIEVHVSSSHE